MECRVARRADLPGLLHLYEQLHGESFPAESEDVKTAWERLLAHPGMSVIVGEAGGRIVTSCTMTVIPNLTHEQRPYAVIENVVTERECRRKGYATAALHFARELAKRAGCYKLMLMTGSKKESTLDFYRRAGYNSEDKTAFVQWL